MKQVAVIADVHADLAAFEVALAAAEQAGCEAVWCLGDVIGRGPQPIECLELALARCERLLLGNHEAYQLDPEHFEPTLTEHGRQEFLPTRELLAQEPRWPALAERIKDLSSYIQDGRLLLIHASPSDSLWHRLSTQGELFLIGRAFAAGTVILFGHTHIPTYGCYRAGGATRLALGREELGYLTGEETAPSISFDQEAVHFANPGSVGVPRRGRGVVEWGLLTLGDDGGPLRFEWRGEPSPT